MEECFHQDLARSIGISNFNSEKITCLLKSAKITPVNNQVEINTNFNQAKLIDFCKKHHITVTCHFTLERKDWDNELINTPIISQLAKKYNKTPKQIVLRFVVQQGAVPILWADTESQMKENMEIFDFELKPDDMSAIHSEKFE